MSTQAITTMSTLLSDLKDDLLDFKNSTLSTVRTYQRGVVGPLAVFPVIAMLPLSEEYIYGRSNGKYKIRRNIDLEIYARDFDTKDGFDKGTDIVDAIKNIFQNNHTISDNAYSSQWNNQEMGEAITYNNRVIQRFLISLSSVSSETMPVRVNEETINSDVAPKTLISSITSAIENNKASYTNLNKIKTLIDSVVKPIATYPAVFVGIPTGSRNHVRPGADDLNINLEVHVLTKIVAKESNLNFNLSIVDDLKDLLQVNYQFSGNCENSTIDRINYEIDDKDLLYTSVFKMTCKMREYL